MCSCIRGPSWRGKINPGGRSHLNHPSHTTTHESEIQYIFIWGHHISSIKMDLPRQFKPKKGTKPLLSTLPNSPLTSSSPNGHGHSARQKEGSSAPKFPLPVVRTNHAGVVISKIEDIFESIADCMLGEKKELTIKLKSRTRREEMTGENQDENQTSDETSARKKRPKDLFRNITFPSKSPQEAWKFSEFIISSPLRSF